MHYAPVVRVGAVVHRGTDQRVPNVTRGSSDRMSCPTSGSATSGVKFSSAAARHRAAGSSPGAAEASNRERVSGGNVVTRRRKCASMPRPTGNRSGKVA